MSDIVDRLRKYPTLSAEQAIAELQRKDAEIERLREKLAALLAAPWRTIMKHLPVNQLCSYKMISRAALTASETELAK